MFENAFNNMDRVMRNDDGLASELDYAEQTSWLLFLKYLDDLESEREDAAVLQGQDYAPILDAAYRWQTWAAPKKDGKLDHNAAMTGDDLIAFVNLKLFPYLKKFRETAADADTIEYKVGEIFSEITNKFRSGYSLRDALEIVDTLSFNSQQAKHELSDLYETRIRRMGNAGRNGGEYYTPAPADPRDDQGRRPEDRRDDLRRRLRLRRLPLRGLGVHAPRRPLGLRVGHAPAPHLLRPGEEVARLRPRHHEHDPARHRGAEHPPHQHAHRERDGHPGARPPRHRAGQPALRRRRAPRGPAELPRSSRARPPTSSSSTSSASSGPAAAAASSSRTPSSATPTAPASRCARSCWRAATCTPCSTAPAARSRARASRRWCCSSRRARRPARVWYYQLDPGRSLGKTNPLNDADLAEFVALQPGRADGPKSWTVDVADLDRTTWDLSVKNPNAPEEAALRSPEEIIDAMLARDAETARILEDIRGML